MGNAKDQKENNIDDKSFLGQSRETGKNSEG
jgi:hypothetical protein